MKKMTVKSWFEIRIQKRKLKFFGSDKAKFFRHSLTYGYKI